MHTQARSVGRFLYNHNPFYLLSACLVLYGLQTAFQDGGSVPENAWLLVSTLSGYTLLLAITAYAAVRFGRVWEDARSLALLVIFMFVAISVSLDQICNTFPSTAALAGGVTFFLYFQLFDIAALRFVSLRTKGKAAMLAVA